MEVMPVETLQVPAAATVVFLVRVRADGEGLARGSNPIRFHLTALDDAAIAVHERSVFFAH